MNEAGGPEVLVLETVADPQPGPGEVVVALKAAALNRRDVFVRKGVAKVPLPLTLGSDGAGMCLRGFICLAKRQCSGDL